MQCLFFKASTIKVARVIEKVSVGNLSHVDYDGFFHHGCCHFSASSSSDLSVDSEGGGKGDRGRSLSR